MKKLFVILLMMGQFFPINARADNNYPDDETIAAPQSVAKTLDSKIDISFYGLGFYSYDGGENYALSGGFYEFNGFGLNINIRSNWKFKDHQNTLNGDFVLNYSFGVYKNNDDLLILITPEVGPSVGIRSIDDEDGKAKDKVFIDGFVGIKGVVAYKKVVLSAGYHIWAPKWKFGKNEKVDGFYAQLGINF